MNATAETAMPGSAQQPPRTDKPLVPVGTGAIEAFASASNFEQAWRMAQALSSSDLVPEAYRNKPANSLIALNIASRLQADVMAVMQSLDVIHGRPSWRSTFIIAAINTSGKFSPLRFELTGEGMARKCIAWAKDRSGERLEGPEVSMAMAKAEGWLEKNGSKWKTLPELMLRYRAAAFFGRLYAPEILLGMQTAEEVSDVIDVTPTHAEPTTGIAGAKALLADAPGKASDKTPHFDKDSAILALKSTPDFKALAKAYEDVVKDFADTNRQLPIEIEAAYEEHKIALEQAQG
jgi:hypothetical protein